jgi:zinc protease
MRVLRRFVLIIVMLASLALSKSVAAQEKLPPLPKDLPPYGPLIPFQTPNVQVSKLSNGLTVWRVARPGFPKVALTLAVRGGRAYDPKDRPGLSDLLMATMDEGTKTRSAKQIAEAFQGAGGDLSGDLRPDALLTSVQVMSDKADATLAVLADMAESATFPDDEVALAKTNALQNLQAQEAEPSFLAQRALAKALYGAHPYSVISATADSINQTTAGQIRAAYHQRFRPDQSLLVAVGDFDSGALEASIEKYFGGWTAPSEPPPSAPPKPPGDNPHAIFLVPRPGSVQTTLTMASFGPRRSDPDYAAAEVANAIYAGMFGSRLIRNIREDKGYTYSPGGSIQLRAEAATVQTRADVRNAVTGPSLNEIFYELNRMATTEPAADEITNAQRYLVGTNAIFLQIQSAVASQLGWLWVYGLPPEALGQESADIQKVTVADVTAAGRKYFPAARQTVVAVGEEQGVRDQLAVFGLPIEAAPK